MNNDLKWIKLMEIGAKLGCHQMPERSFSFRNYQFPICARCTGVIISAFISFFLFLKRKMSICLCLMLSSVMLIDWLIQYLKIKESTNIRRFVTGLIGGFGYCTLHLHVYYFLYKKIKLIFQVYQGS